MALVSKLSDVIATREIELVLKDGAKETYLVSIARPELAETRDSYFCAHEFLSETFEKIINIHGVDPFQALDTWNISSANVEVYSIFRASPGTAFQKAGRYKMHNKSLHGTSSPPLRGYKLARELKRYVAR